MTCKEVVELMTGYLDGTLSAADRARFEVHISGCDGCHAYLAQLRMTRTLLGKLGNEPVPELIQSELLEAFRSWRSGAQA